jgi:small basic protein
MSSTHTAGSEPLFSKPSSPVGIVAVVMATVTGVLHLLAVMNAIQFDQTLAILFALNGLGFLGGIVVYLSRYWRRPLFLVAAAYAIVTILALFPERGWGLEAFYMEGSINPIIVITKAAEAILAACALYLYAGSGE